MNQMRQVVAGVMLTCLWPGMALSQTVGPDAQGKAAGQPEMREPYGFDQDRSREETGNQGRPIGLPAAKLPAPSLLSVMWSGGFLELTKQMILVADPRAKLAGFRVYEQRPGEPGFHPFVEFTLDAIGGIWSKVTPEGAIVVYRYDTATQVRLMLLDVRSDVSKWAAGTYRHYAVATDAAGREGEASAILPCTLLDLPVTYPTEGATVTEPFTVRWTDVLNDIKPGTHLWESLYQLDFAKTPDPRNPRPQSAQHTEGACGITQTEYYYTKEPFVAGSPYLMVLRAYLNLTNSDPAVTARYGYILGVSRPIHFSAGNPPPGRIVIMPRPPASPALAPPQPAVRLQPAPEPALPQPAARPQSKPEPAAAAPQRRPDPPPQAQGQPPQRGRQPVAPRPAPPAAVRGRR